jgi:hypothetical protein
MNKIKIKKKKKKEQYMQSPNRKEAQLMLQRMERGQ